MKLLVSLSLLPLLLSCSTVERAMAGRVGCTEDEIRILSTSPGWGVVNTTWVAECRGQQYTCSLRPGAGSINDVDDMNCALRGQTVVGRGDYEMGDARSQSFEEFVDRFSKRSSKIRSK